MKERHPDAELGDDVEIFYYLFPMDHERTTTKRDHAEPTWRQNKRWESMTQEAPG